MYLVLTAYWLIFWQRFLRNPYLLATSEIATTNFPHWLWMGRKWRATDDLYYKYPASIPFLSMWYWPNVLVARLSKHFSLNTKFRIYAYFILLHYLLASFIAYEILGLFGAITLTYAGYCIKPQTPSFVYTMTWMPGMLIGGPIGWISCGMYILGGYFPILVYFLPVAAILNPSCLFGLLIGLPQLLPFLWYWKKSVRSGEKSDREMGKLPWWKLKDLVWPTNNVATTNGVHYPEVAMYMGIAIIYAFSSLWILCGVVAALICMGLIPSIQRIPARSLYLLSFSLALCSPREIQSNLLVLQMFLLLRNSSIYPSFPFSQWWDKPSKIYPKADYTGYLTETKINDYRGGFCLKDAA